MTDFTESHPHSAGKYEYDEQGRLLGPKPATVTELHPQGGPVRRFLRKLRKPNDEARTLLSGKEVHLRFIQSAMWSTVAGVLGASFVAGLYYLILQQYWHVPGTAHGASLKAWWDGGMGWIHSGNWAVYRHGIRDLCEPAFAIMAVRTLLASPKHWDDRVGTARLIIAPVVLMAAAVGMAIGGVWLLNFSGMPAFWGSQLVLGIVISQVLHRWWAPVGATLQGFVLDRSVDVARGGSLLTRPHVPLWETYPLSPPVMRERFAMKYRNDTTIEARGTHRLVMTLLVAVLILVTVAGVLAKFLIAKGVYVPYMG